MKSADGHHGCGPCAWDQCCFVFFRCNVSYLRLLSPDFNIKGQVFLMFLQHTILTILFRVCICFERNYSPRLHLIVKTYIMPQQISISNTFALFHAEASAKTRDGVQCAFEELVEKILQTPGLWESVHKTRGVALSELSETGQGGCGAYCSLL